MVPPIDAHAAQHEHDLVGARGRDCARQRDRRAAGLRERPARLLEPFALPARQVARRNNLRKRRQRRNQHRRRNAIDAAPAGDHPHAPNQRTFQAILSGCARNGRQSPKTRISCHCAVFSTHAAIPRKRIEAAVCPMGLHGVNHVPVDARGAPGHGSHLLRTSNLSRALARSVGRDRHPRDRSLAVAQSELAQHVDAIARRSCRRRAAG